MHSPLADGVIMSVGGAFLEAIAYMYILCPRNVWKYFSEVAQDEEVTVSLAATLLVRFR